MGKTSIEWATDVWNPATGCTKISPGCKACYMFRDYPRLARLGVKGYAGGTPDQVRVWPDKLDQPLHWKKPRRIFVNSMSDLFHEDIPDEFIGSVFATMWREERHTFQILTKRADRMLRWYRDWYKNQRGGKNIWLGVSCEDQQRADERIPLLLQTPAAVRFLSLEPLLGPIDLRSCPSCGNFYRDGHDCETDNPTAVIHWVIVGGESGGPPERALVGRTTSNHVWNRGKVEYIIKAEALKWVRGIRDQCVAAKVPFFHKQWGGVTPKSGGRMLDGREWSQFPGGR